MGVPPPGVPATSRHPEVGEAAMLASTVTGSGMLEGVAGPGAVTRPQSW